MRWWNEYQERKRQRKLARKWSSLRAKAKVRIEYREGREFAADLLRKTKLDMSYQYQVTQSRSSWRNDTETAIKRVIGWKVWDKLNYHNREKLSTGVLELVFKRAGADWNCSAGSLGLGLDAAHWARIGVEARKMVKDQILLMKLAQ